MTNNQKGFTIVELLIATAVFSVILLLCAAGLLQIGRTYYKGVTSTRTQEAARAIIDEISRNIQFGTGGVYILDTVNGSAGYCIGNKRYSYIQDKQLVEASPGPDQSLHVMVVDDGISACSGGIDAQDMLGTPTGRELVSTRMRIANFNVDRVGSSNLYAVTVKIISGESDILNASHDGCSSERAGTQYCAVSELTTTVQKRLR